MNTARAILLTAGLAVGLLASHSLNPAPFDAAAAKANSLVAFHHADDYTAYGANGQLGGDVGTIINLDQPSADFATAKAHSLLPFTDPAAPTHYDGLRGIWDYEAGQ
jgi:hypothetical protein